MNQDMDVKSRKPIIAGILSLLVPGLGQVYNTQWKKGLLFFLLLNLGLFIQLKLGILGSYGGYIFMIIYAIGIYLINIIDAILTASRQGQVMLKKYNNAFIYTVIILSGIFINMIISNEASKVFETHIMRGLANEPLITEGNKLMVDKMAYKHHPIQRGDLVAFKNPMDTTEIWISRVMGLPNDSIKINSFIPTVGYEVPTITLKGDTLIRKDQLMVMHEKWPNFEMDILVQSTDSLYKHGNYPTMIIPDNMFYILGDHRVQSYDSRFLGPIHRNAIIGKVNYIISGLKSGQSRHLYNK